MLTPQYIHLPSGSSTQALDVEPPFAAIVIIDAEVSPEWRHEVSEWLIEAGCLNMMAWGRDCSLWDDSVDWAFLKAFNFGDYPEEKFVTTSWHEDESLEDVFHFALGCLEYSGTLVESIVILDVRDISREDVILARFNAVEDELFRGFSSNGEINSNRIDIELVGSVVLGLIILLLLFAKLSEGLMQYDALMR